jgi:hypothetical protein
MDNLCRQRYAAIRIQRSCLQPPKMGSLAPGCPKVAVSLMIQFQSNEVRELRGRQG